MIYAIGHDIVENQRIANIWHKAGEQFVKRILTADEQATFNTRNDKVKFLAKRFAAKEAFAKACGTGLRAPVLLSNISILNDELGKPYFALAPELSQWLDQLKITAYHLTISDEKTLSSAVVILEK